MSDSIRLSEKYGVNPSLIKCIFCGEAKGIAFMGKLKGDKEAPRECIMDYEPCDKCKEKFSQGVTLIGVQESPIMPGMPPISTQEGKDLYPTGSVVVLKEEAAQRIFSAPEMKKGFVTLADEEVIKDLKRMAKEAPEEVKSEDE